MTRPTPPPHPCVRAHLAGRACVGPVRACSDGQPRCEACAAAWESVVVDCKGGDAREVSNG